MPYVDGFLLAVPKARLAEYRKIARKAASCGASMARFPTWNAWAMTCRWAS